MDRRKALKLFGILFACLVGRPVLAKELKIENGTEVTHDFLILRDSNKPIDYVFEENGIGNIIIERKNGTKIEVPFSDICDALQDND